MASFFRHLSVCFAAGAFGGLVNALFVWGAGQFGLTELIGVAMAPAWSPPWLYQRMVWGGFWGLLFLAPLLSQSVWVRGALFGLFPSAVMLMLIFPKVLGKGMFGLELGQWTPLFVLAANAAWGVAAAWWMVLCREKSRARGLM